MAKRWTKSGTKAGHVDPVEFIVANKLAAKLFELVNILVLAELALR